MKKLFILVIVSILAASCQSTVPPCVSESKKDIVIRWGYYNMEKKKISAYEITTDAKLHYVESDTSLLHMTRETLAQLDFNDYCKAQNFTGVVILRTQALNVPAPLTRFVELIDSSKGMGQRGVWNPFHENVGSRQYRLLYDSLMKLVPEDCDVFLKSFN